MQHLKVAVVFYYPPRIHLIAADHTSQGLSQYINKYKCINKYELGIGTIKHGVKRCCPVHM